MLLTRAQTLPIKFRDKYTNNVATMRPTRTLQHISMG